MAPALVRKNFVDKKLRIRMRIFLGISFVLAVLMLIDIVQGYIAWWLAILAALVGLGIGYVFGRLIKIVWHPTEDKVMSRMDLLGGLAIAAYIALAIARSIFAGRYFTGHTLTAFTFAVVAGILLGRVLGLRIGIKNRIEAGRS